MFDLNSLSIKLEESGCYLQQLGKLMNTVQVGLGVSSHKKVYQFVLSAKQPSEQLSLSLDYLIKNCLSSSEHFGFLLHRINWLETPFTNYREQLFKLLRLYRSCNRQSHRVVYNLLIEGFFSARTYKQSLSVLIRLLRETLDQQGIIAALKENYPHKTCSLDIHSFYLENMLQICKSLPHLRTDCLEIIIENMTKFDTEIISGDDLVHRPFPNDQKILEIRKTSNRNDLSQKLDALLLQIISFLQQLGDDPTILNEMLLVFEHKVLPIKTTKNIQLLVFYLAQQTKANSNSFIAFLLSNIFDTNPQCPNWHRVFAQSNFYLFSYFLRSKKITEKILSKTFLLLVQRLSSFLSEIDAEAINEKSELKQLLQAKQGPLLILQTIIMIKSKSHHLNKEEFNTIYQRLLNQSASKLHYQYFLKWELLEKQHTSHRNHLRLKFSNKFLPSTLMEVGNRIDPLMQINCKPKDAQIALEAESGIPQKKNKIESNVHRDKHGMGQTPISHSSETVI